MTSLEYWLNQFHIFLFVLLRVSALLIVAPIFGGRQFLARAKIGLAFMVSLVIFPTVLDTPFIIPEGLLPYSLVLFREVFLGIILGFTVLLLFIGIQFAGPIGQKLIELTATTFVIAIKISAPIILSLFAVTVAMGILARTVPQMNVFIVGFPVQLAVGLFILVASMPLFNIFLQKSLIVLQRDLYAILEFLG